MALTLNQFTGFETGGLEEATGGASGSPDATEATIVRSGARSLKMPDAGHSFTINLFDEVSNAGNDHIFGFGFYMEAWPTVTMDLVECRDSSAARSLRLQLTDAGLILVRGQGGTEITSSAMSVGSWHYIEMYFQNSNTGASEFFIDDVSQGTDASADYLTATLTDFNILGHSNQDGIHYFDDFYWLSGATAASDRYGPGVSVYGYGPGRNSATSDWNDGGTPDAGNDLEVGTWLAPSNVPWDDTTVRAEYTNASVRSGIIGCDDDAGGAGLGPLNGSKIVSGTIVAGKWGFRGDRSGGGSTTQEINFGSSPTSTGGINLGAGSPKVVTLLSGVATNHFVVLPASDTGVPAAGDMFGIGISNDGGRDWELIAYQCFLLHVSETVVTDLSDGLMPEYPSHGLTVEV